MPGTFSPPPTSKETVIVSDPDMHHGTCMKHVPWCMSGSLTRCGGENVPGACATRNFTYLVRDPLEPFSDWQSLPDDIPLYEWSCESGDQYPRRGVHYVAVMTVVLNCPVDQVGRVSQRWTLKWRAKLSPLLTPFSVTPTWNLAHALKRKCCYFDEIVNSDNYLF